MTIFQIKNELKAISIFKSASCLKDWTVSRIQDSPIAFRDELNRCFKEKFIARDQYELLNELARNLEPSRIASESSNKNKQDIKSLLVKLGNLPEILKITLLYRFQILRIHLLFIIPPSFSDVIDKILQA